MDQGPKPLRLLDRAFDHIDELPAEQQSEEMLRLGAVILHRLPAEAILKVRNDLLRQYPDHERECDCGACSDVNVVEFIELIEGHLALRKLGGQDATLPVRVRVS